MLNWITRVEFATPIFSSQGVLPSLPHRPVCFVNRVFSSQRSSAANSDCNQFNPRSQRMLKIARNEALSKGPINRSFCSLGGGAKCRRPTFTSLHLPVRPFAYELFVWGVTLQAPCKTRTGNLQNKRIPTQLRRLRYLFDGLHFSIACDKRKTRLHLGGECLIESQRQTAQIIST